MDVYLDIFQENVNQLDYRGLQLGFFQNDWEKYHTTKRASEEL
jgi:hypothetical protein